MCSKCGGSIGPAVYYDVDENAQYCGPCAVRAHHPKCNGEMNSMEKIVTTETSGKGVALISPIVDEIFTAVIVIVLLRYSFIHEDYLYSPTVCPVSSQVRKLFTYIDSGLFYYNKDAWNVQCNLEDSYWRLFLDCWVRSIVTLQDNLLVMAVTFYRAWFFKLISIHAIVPAVAMVYSAFVGTWLFIEGNLPRSPPLVALESFAAKLNCLPFDKGLMAPATAPRERASTDYMDAYKYWKHRYMRNYTHIFESTKGTMITLINKPIRYAIGFRLLCMLLPIGEHIRAILSYCGMGSTITQHLQWFQDSSMFGFEISDKLFRTTIMSSSSMAYAFVFSDFLRKLIGRLFGFATYGLSFLTGASGMLIGTSLDLWFVAIPPLIYYGVKRYLEKLKAKQQAEFSAAWNGGEREKVIGAWCTQEEYLKHSPF
jgi:hypothetical protein